jgi:predicted  nucleic acid-binding Zn-ribbon protein
MATAADRIAALEKVVRVLEIREQVQAAEIAQLREADRQLREEQAQSRDDIGKLREELAKVVTASAVNATDVIDLKKHREHWSQRAWQIGAGVLLAVIGGVIGYLLKR